ncbi:hypothetical protein ABIE40_000026 [Rhizobium sp. OAE497]
MLLLSQVTIEAEDKKTVLIRPFAFPRGSSRPLGASSRRRMLKN